jgi:hypothetical protein
VQRWWKASEGVRFVFLTLLVMIIGVLAMMELAR